MASKRSVDVLTRGHLRRRIGWFSQEPDDRGSDRDCWSRGLQSTNSWRLTGWCFFHRWTLLVRDTTVALLRSSSHRHSCL